VTNEQLYLAIGIPSVVNAAFIGLLVAYMNAKFMGFGSRFEVINERFEVINQRFEVINERFDAIEKRLDSINKRFDDMRDLWRAELRRVEEILDARLKHLEERP
jgi:chromosome segregation ATPase